MLYTHWIHLYLELAVCKTHMSISDVGLLDFVFFCISMHIPLSVTCSFCFKTVAVAEGSLQVEDCESGNRNY